MKMLRMKFGIAATQLPLGSITAPYRSCLRQIRFSGLALLIGSAFISIGVSEETAPANPPPTRHVYTVEEIADAMATAEAQFTSLRMKYVIDMPKPGAATTGQRQVIEGTHAFKLPEGWVYREEKYSYSDPLSQQSTVVIDRLDVFNGDTTVHLDRKKDRRSHMNATIDPGRNDYYVESGMEPHNGQIWSGSVGSITYSMRLKDKESIFQMASQNELIGGLNTVKLTGTTSIDKVLTTTLWICPERSFLPLKVQLVRTATRKIVVNRVCSDLVQLENGMWYPQTVRHDDPAAPNWVITTKITEISAKPLSHEFFEVPIPPDTKVEDHVSKTFYLTLNPGKTPTDPKDFDAAERALDKYVEELNQQAAEAARGKTQGAVPKQEEGRK